MSQTFEGPNKIWNRQFITVFLINALLHLCTYAMNSLASKFAVFLGAGLALVGLVASIHSTGALVFKIISAPAVDSFNRKKVLLFAIGLMFAAFVGYSLSNSASALLVFRIMQGAAMAFTTVGCLTMASDALPQDRIGTGIGYFAVSSAICQAIAPGFGLWLNNKVGYNKTFFVFAVILLITFVYALTLKSEHNPSGHFRISVKTIVAKEALPIAVMVCFLNLAFANISGFLILYGESRGLGDEISIYFTVYAVTLFITRPIIGRLSDKLGTLKVALPSMAFFALAFLLLSFSKTLPMFLLCAVISSFGYGGVQPALQAACMKSVPKERRGSASTTNYLGTDIGHFLGPVFAGVILDRFNNYPMMWRLLIIPIICAAVTAIVMRKKLAEIDAIKKSAG